MTFSRLALFAGMVVLVAVLAPGIAADLIAGYRDTFVASEKTTALPQERQAGPRQVVVEADPRGHFVSTARINGRSVEIMVDTGASVVALSAQTARRLGIVPPKSAFGVSTSTANGAVKTAPITLSEIKLGNVAIRDVRAIVIPGEMLTTNLLGMSFLRRLSGFEIDKGKLVLTQ